MLYFLSALILMVCTCMWPAVVFAQEPRASGRAYPVKVLWKLTRGVTNVLTGWAEIPMQAYQEGTRAADAGGSLADIAASNLVGGAVGTGYFIKRTVLGVYDVATFAIPSRAPMLPALPLTPFELYLDEAGANTIPSEAPDAGDGHRPMPLIADLLFARLLGTICLVNGTVLVSLATPIVAVIPGDGRVSGMWSYHVARPARFVFATPLGVH